MLGVVSTIAFVAIFGFVNSIDEKVVPEKKWVIAPRFLTLQKGITKEEARKWMENEYLPLYRHYAGWNAMLGEPLRSSGWDAPNSEANEKGDFVLMFFFDTQETRDYYFPLDGSWRDNKEISQVLKDHKSTWEQLFGKYFVQNKFKSEEYLMYARAK